MPISALVLDVTGQDVPETGLVFDEGDRDMLMWPAPGSMVRIPWLDVPSAQYVASIHDLDGTAHFFDPRSVLEKIVNRTTQELGMSPVGAIELEFFLMDRDAALAGRPRAPQALINYYRPQQYQAYYLQDLDDFAPFFKDLYAWCEVQGLPAKTLISEYAPGQMEIVLRHRGDVLKACDEAIMLKRLDWHYVRFGGARTHANPHPPSYYWKRQFYVTFEDDPLGIRARDYIGTNTILWGNDYPHGDSVFPNSQKVAANRPE